MEKEITTECPYCDYSNECEMKASVESVSCVQCGHTYGVVKTICYEVIT